MNILVGANTKGDRLILLVLEPGNIHRLKQGQPIPLRIQDLFPDGIPKKLELAIHYSDTPVADFKELSKTSDMKFDERTPVSQRMKPHCSECKSTIEQMGIWKNDTPIALAFCPMCGCTFGIIPSSTFVEGST